MSSDDAPSDEVRRYTKTWQILAGLPLDEPRTVGEAFRIQWRAIRELVAAGELHAIDLGIPDLVLLVQPGVPGAVYAVSTSGVTSIQADALPPILGAVRLVSGAGIALSESGQNITITNASPGGGGVTSLEPDALGALVGAIRLLVGAGLSIGAVGNDVTLVNTAPDTPAVNSLKADAAAALTGAVRLVSGANVTLTEAGQDITIAAAGGGGGTTVYTPDDAAQFAAVWGADLGMDYEANDAGTSPPTGWSWVNQGTSTLARQFNRLVLSPQAAPALGEDHRILVRAIPAAATWNAFIKLTTVGATSRWQRGGFILRDSVSGKYVFYGPSWDPASAVSAVLRIHLNEWSALNTFSTTVREDNTFPTFPPYLRIRRNSATSVDYMFSIDGVVWAYWAQGANTSAFFTPDQIGILTNSPGIAGQTALQFFRVR